MWFFFFTRHFKWTLLAYFQFADAIVFISNKNDRDSVYSSGVWSDYIKEIVGYFIKITAILQI